MTTPDSDAEHKPGEVTPPPEALAGGQRTLAAIVFTDTVGFSALMSKNEESALRLIARDINQMKATCTAFGGQVLKGTGDGLLMLFTSAVQAVACALEIQREFQRQNLERPRDEQLQHRIGIHLGDVFQQNGDVMGDGVNIAARLQTQAIPGGICLSNTVYDVVHNRLPFYVNDLGARKLKNIGMVTAYQISPMEGAQSSYRMAWYRWRSAFWWSVGAFALLVILFVAFKWGQTHGVEKVKKHDADKQAQVAARREKEKALLSATPLPIDPALPEVSESEFEIVRRDHMQRYDFDGMKEWISRHNWPGKSSAKLHEKCEEFDHLFDWTFGHMQGRNATQPLHVIGSDRKKISFWLTPFGGLKMKIDDRVQTMQRETIPASIIVSMTWELMTENPLSEGEGTLLNRELDDFIEYYHVKTNEPLAAPQDASTKP